MKNLKNNIAIISSLFAMLLLSACNAYSPPTYKTQSIHTAPQHYNLQGRVSSIEVLTVESRNSGGGAVLGAILGGVVGHQMGGGKGRDVTTGLGAVGGALAGHEIEKRSKKEGEIYRITVSIDNGRTQQFDYQNIGDLRVGDRVKIENGQLYQL